VKTRQDNKPVFRSIARREAYEYLQRRLKEAQIRLKNNKYEIASLARQQGQLKTDIAGLNQLLQEFLK
jgi:two-component sensor histidine kinase